MDATDAVRAPFSDLMLLSPLVGTAFLGCVLGGFGGPGTSRWSVLPPPAPPEVLPVAELPTPEQQKLMARLAPASHASVFVPLS